MSHINSHKRTSSETKRLKITIQLTTNGPRLNPCKKIEEPHFRPKYLLLTAFKQAKIKSVEHEAKTAEYNVECDD